MLLWKLIRIAGVLKNLELEDCIVDGKADIQKIVERLDERRLSEICEICTGTKSTNELDAIAGIADFFLKLRNQVKTSPNLLELVQSCPLADPVKEALLKVIGTI
jgi:hypothetical protein